jgi:hypothetical protein
MIGGKNTKDDIRERMFHEMKDKHIFNLVREYAFEYADNAPDRNVFPTPEAMYVPGLQHRRIFHGQSKHL